MNTRRHWMRHGRHDALTRLPNRGPLAHRGQRARFRRELRRVIAGAQLTVHYQPIVSLPTGALCGLEALARWPKGGTMLAPTEFIPAAEDSGMIAALGRHVLETALHTLAGWRRGGVVAGDVCVSVNLSARQLEHPRFADQVRAALASAGLTADMLKLELTESTPIGDLKRARQSLADLCADGVGLHLDDFGTGCSSLTALHRLPVDALKIDRSFVAGLGEGDGAAEVIVGSTAAMAHRLGLPVIAEGIEHPAQLEQLRALGCDFGQGHLFSPALAAEEMGVWLASWAGWEAPVELVAA
jgi:EAL domain-containing protein (putative c-di-GMP-specific phosphodiesterase class I)